MFEQYFCSNTACGYTRFLKDGEKCPVCGAIAEKFGFKKSAAHLALKRQSHKATDIIRNSASPLTSDISHTEGTKDAPQPTVTNGKPAVLSDAQKRAAARLRVFEREKAKAEFNEKFEKRFGTEDEFVQKFLSVWNKVPLIKEKNSNATQVFGLSLYATLLLIMIGGIFPASMGYVVLLYQIPIFFMVISGFVIVGKYIVRVLVFLVR